MSALESTRADILTRSGQYFDFLRPEAYRLDIEDIAHGLSMVCRFAGQCKEFYSVAQHSVLASHLVPRQDAYAALMHDCAEAFIGDVSRPLKLLLADYRAIEKRVEAALFAQLGIPVPLPASVKRADLIMLATEQRVLMPAHDDEWAVLAGVEPDLSIEILPMTPDEAFGSFMARYKQVAPRNSRA